MREDDRGSSRSRWHRCRPCESLETVQRLVAYVEAASYALLLPAHPLGNRRLLDRLAGEPVAGGDARSGSGVAFRGIRHFGEPASIAAVHRGDRAEPSRSQHGRS